MYHGCYHLCPKVREQLRKARAQAGEDPEKVSPSDSELSVVAGPSNVQPPEATSKRSKDSKKLPPAAASPSKIRSPRRSHETAYRQDQQYPSGRVSPTKSANASRKSDPEKRSHRRSKDSQRTREYPSRHGSPIKSPDASIKFGPGAKSHRRNQENDQKSSRSFRQEQKVHSTSQSGSATKSYKRSKKKGNEFDDGAGPSVKRTGAKNVPDESKDFEESFSAHNLCDSHCRGINERMRKLRDENQQQALDKHLVYESLPYFGDLCTCCCRCLVKQLWNDHFVNTTLASAALFAVGLKLCSDLNGWTVTNSF